MGRRRVTNWNAMVDFMRRNEGHLKGCGCDRCAKALEEWLKFSSGQDSRKRYAMDAMNVVSEEHGLR